MLTTSLNNLIEPPSSLLILTFIPPSILSLHPIFYTSPFPLLSFTLGKPMHHLFLIPQYCNLFRGNPINHVILTSVCY